MFNHRRTAARLCRSAVAGVGVVATVAAMLVSAQAASAAPPPLPGCLSSDGSGGYTVAAGAPCVVVPPTTVPGNITVGSGAILAMPAGGTVKGSITATDATSIYLLNVHVTGDVSFTGGGFGPQCQAVQSDNPPSFTGRDLVLKENTIDGSLSVTGWSGCWLGVLRNGVGGNLTIENNYANPDNHESDGTAQGLGSTAINTNTIHGNLTCSGNTPAARYSYAAVAAPVENANKVFGTASGECIPISAVTVNVMAQDHNNGALDIPANGLASYYAAGWHGINDLNPNNPKIVRTQLLPGTYTFAAIYNGTREQKKVTVEGGHAQTVYFHAARVNVMVQNHRNDAIDIPAEGSASYYARGWHPITDQNTNNGKIVQTEMLPGTYSFAATLNGTRQQKKYTVIEPNPNNHAHADQTVYFHAARVNLQMQSLNCAGHVSGIVSGDASYYASGWHAMSTHNANNPKIMQAEMLPGTYTFAAKVGSQRIQKKGTVIEPNPNNHAHANQIVYANFAAQNCPAS